MKKWLTWDVMKNVAGMLTAIGLVFAFFNLLAALPAIVAALLFFGAARVFNGRDPGLRGGDHGGPDGSE